MAHRAFPTAMRQQAKWFQNATMMAFFAVFALLVSPALALGCCHGAAPAHSFSLTISHSIAPNAVVPYHAVAQRAAPSQPASAHACCAPAKPTVKRVKPNVCVLEMGAAMTGNCSCNQVLSPDAYTVSNLNASSSFAPFALALAALPFALDLFVQDVRLAATAHHAARPRSPDRTTAPGRAPPILALS